MLRLLPAAFLLLLASCPTAPPPAAPPSSLQSHVDFDSQVKPILQTRCTPCHFPGGVMHAKLPFDQADQMIAEATRRWRSRPRRTQNTTSGN